jgi:sulfur-oxidizing protein SoxY
MDRDVIDTPVLRPKRRQFLRTGRNLLIAACCSLVEPLRAFAADWNKPAFDARGWEGVLKGLNASSPAVSKDILLKAPAIAEDGADVPVTVASRIPNTQMIAVAVEKNTFPLAASFTFANGVEPEFTIYIKMKRTARVRVLVQADGKHYLTSREVKVTSGSCSA